MIFTIKSSKSNRFVRLSYEGFKPGGNSSFRRYFNAWKGFFRAAGAYLISKIKQIFNLFSIILFFLIRLPKIIKDYIVVKLIWSRGKLGRPVATLVVMVAGIGVFLMSEVFSNLNFVVAQTANADYLSSSADIIPRRDVATTTIPDERKSTEPFSYKVEPGDTLFGIGEKFKISLDALKYVNSLSDTDVLKIGQDIVIPPVSGLIHKVAKGDTLTSIATKYDVPSQAIADFNYVLDTSTLALGTELVIPGAKVPEPVIPVYEPPAFVASPSYQGTATPSKNFCVWPTTVRIITQYFTWYHNGIDVATPWGGGMPPLFACTGGKVIRAGWDPYGLGLHVRIDHGNGYETVYGHMSRINVSYGQRVSRGQVIGLLGNTGRSTGPHVHFMVKFNGIAQNPLSYTN